MGHYVNILETYHNMDDSGNIVVPLEKFDEIRKRYVTQLLKSYNYWMYYDFFITICRFKGTNLQVLCLKRKKQFVCILIFKQFNQHSGLNQVSRDQVGIPWVPSHHPGPPEPDRCQGPVLENTLQVSGDHTCSSAGLACECISERVICKSFYY